MCPNVEKRGGSGPFEGRRGPLPGLRSADGSGRFWGWRLHPPYPPPVLRWKPNIQWAKDRGKNPPGSPWGEDRDNDKHLSLAEKRAARGE